MIAQQTTLGSRLRHLELLILLGALQAFAPLSIDMYLPAMPVIEKVFHTTTASVQMTMVTFLLGYALGQPLYGPITDRFGRKPPLYASLLVFIAASAACAISPSIPVMSAARLVQAIGACGGAVMSRAMVTDLFPAKELRRIFSMLVLVLGVSPVIAPLIGSYLLVWFGWNSAFIVQALLGTVCLVGMHFRLPESLAHDARRPLAYRCFDQVHLRAAFQGPHRSSAHPWFADSVRLEHSLTSRARHLCSSFFTRCRRNVSAGSLERRLRAWWRLRRSMGACRIGFLCGACCGPRIRCNW